MPIVDHKYYSRMVNALEWVSIACVALALFIVSTPLGLLGIAVLLASIANGLDSPPSSR